MAYIDASLDPKIAAYCEDDLVDIGGFDRCELMELKPGYFHMRAYPGSDCMNNTGTVHGGFLLALADIAGTAASDSLGQECSTTSMDAHFLRPVRDVDEYLDVKGEVVKRGRTLNVSEVHITRPDGKLAFQATVTMAMLDSFIMDL